MLRRTQSNPEMGSLGIHVWRRAKSCPMTLQRYIVCLNYLVRRKCRLRESGNCRLVHVDIDLPKYLRNEKPCETWWAIGKCNREHCPNKHEQIAPNAKTFLELPISTRTRALENRIGRPRPRRHGRPHTRPRRPNRNENVSTPHRTPEAPVAAPDAASEHASEEPTDSSGRGKSRRRTRRKRKAGRTNSNNRNERNVSMSAGSGSSSAAATETDAPNSDARLTSGPLDGGALAWAGHNWNPTPRPSPADPNVPRRPPLPGTPGPAYGWADYVARVGTGPTTEEIEENELEMKAAMITRRASEETEYYTSTHDSSVSSASFGRRSSISSGSQRGPVQMRVAAPSLPPAFGFAQPPSPGRSCISSPDPFAVNNPHTSHKTTHFGASAMALSSGMDPHLRVRGEIAESTSSYFDQSSFNRTDALRAHQHHQLHHRQQSQLHTTSPPLAESNNPFHHLMHVAATANQQAEGGTGSGGHHEGHEHDILSHARNVLASSQQYRGRTGRSGRSSAGGSSGTPNRRPWQASSSSTPSSNASSAGDLLAISDVIHDSQSYYPHSGTSPAHGHQSASSPSDVRHSHEMAAASFAVLGQQSSSFFRPLLSEHFASQRPRHQTPQPGLPGAASSSSSALLMPQHPIREGLPPRSFNFTNPQSEASYYTPHPSESTSMASSAWQSQPQHHQHEHVEHAEYPAIQDEQPYRGVGNRAPSRPNPYQPPELFDPSHPSYSRAQTQAPHHQQQQQHAQQAHSQSQSRQQWHHQHTLSAQAHPPAHHEPLVLPGDPLGPAVPLHQFSQPASPVDQVQYYPHRHTMAQQQHPQHPQPPPQYGSNARQQHPHVSPYPSPDTEAPQHHNHGRGPSSDSQDWRRRGF